MVPETPKRLNVSWTHLTFRLRSQCLSVKVRGTAAQFFVACQLHAMTSSWTHSMPGLTVHHQLLEFTQTHVHWEKAMVPHSSTLAWKVPWTEEPGRLQSMGSLESNMTERLHFHFSLSCIGEGNGNPLHCSFLENPTDGEAWWAAVHGVAQSRTRLKQLSSSSSNNNTLFCPKTAHTFRNNSKLK